MTGAKRPYRKRARAAGEQRTRESIIAATLASWADAGPAATTIAGIARTAGVQRLTVYRHFEDDATLAVAAWAAFHAEHPRPDPAGWAAIAAPRKRLRKALRSVYDYYAGAGAVLANVLRDAPAVPALSAAASSHDGWLDGVVATLEPGWRPRGGKRDAVLPVALLEHAVRLSTWQSLSDSGLDRRQTARLIERSMRGLARRGTEK